MERTEEQILSKAPIKVRLGDEEYDIKPLPIMKAREWRSTLVETMRGIVGDMAAEQCRENVGPALTAALCGFPDKVAELVFAWAPQINKEKIMEEATEEQMARAFSAVMVMAYPFLAPLVLVTKVVGHQLKSAGSTSGR